MSNVEEFADALFKHYIEPLALSETQQKMAKAMQHEMTCDDLSHMHGVVKIEWDAPSEVEDKTL